MATQLDYIRLNTLLDECRAEILAQGALILGLGPTSIDPWGAPGAVVEVFEKLVPDYVVVDDNRFGTRDEVLGAIDEIAGSDPWPLWLLLIRDASTRPLYDAIAELIDQSAPAIRLPVPPGVPRRRSSAAAPVA